MTVAPRKMLGADHFRLRSPFSRAAFDRQKVDPSVFPCKFGASLWSPPSLFKQKLQSLTKPPVKYRQMQLVSLKPLTRHSGAHTAGEMDGCRLCRPAEPGGSWGHCRLTSQGASSLCPGPQSRLKLPITHFAGQKMKLQGRELPKFIDCRVSDVPLTHSEVPPGEAGNANEGIGWGGGGSQASAPPIPPLSTLPSPMPCST